MTNCGDYTPPKRPEEFEDGLMVGHGVKFERTRRITGYLVGTLDRFSNAKKTEERMKAKHTGSVKIKEAHGN